MASFKTEYVQAVVKEVRVRAAIKKACSRAESQLLSVTWGELFKERNRMDEDLLRAVQDGRASAQSVVVFRQECLAKAASELLTNK